MNMLSKCEHCGRWQDWHFCPDTGNNREARRARLSRKELGAWLGGSLRWGPPEKPNLRERRFLDTLWFLFLPKVLRATLILLLVTAIVLGCAAFPHLHDGYYTDGGDLLYYRWGDLWFYLPVDRHDAIQWGFDQESKTVPEGLERLGRSWKPEWGASDFKESFTYQSVKALYGSIF